MAVSGRWVSSPVPLSMHTVWGIVDPPSSTGGIAKYCVMAALEQLLSSAELPDYLSGRLTSFIFMKL